MGNSPRLLLIILKTRDILFLNFLVSYGRSYVAKVSFLFIFMYLYSYSSIYIHIHLFIFIFICLYSYSSIYIHIHLFVFIFIYLYSYPSIYIHIHLFIFTFMLYFLHSGIYFHIHVAFSYSWLCYAWFCSFICMVHFHGTRECECITSEVHIHILCRPICSKIQC